MAMNIISNNNPKLKKVCEKVGRRQGIKIGNKLSRFFNGISDAYGLAAPQVGLLYRVFVMRFEGKSEIVINPEILSYGKKKILMKEACLSHPETATKPIKVKRSFEIQVCYYDGTGKARNERLTGMKARIFQHEVNHLNGICIVDL